MIVRLRSSLELKRISLGSSDGGSDEVTFIDLRTGILKNYGLRHDTNIVLSLDSEGSQILTGEDNTALSRLGVTHGAVLYLLGKLQRTVAEKSCVDANGNVVNRGDEVYEIIVEDVPADNPERQSSRIASPNRSLETARVAATVQPLPPLQVPAVFDTDTDADADADAANFHFEEEPKPSAMSPDVRHADSARRERMVDADADADADAQLPSPFRNIDLSRSLLRDIQLQTMLNGTDAYATQSRDAQSGLAARIQSRHQAGLNAGSHRSTSTSTSTGSAGRAAGRFAPPVSDAFEPDVDVYGNPAGTLYTGTIGSGSSSNRQGQGQGRLGLANADAALRLEDLEAEGGDGDGGLPSWVQAQGQGEDYAVSAENGAAAAIGTTVDPDVVAALRSAGYSEFDILMELKQHEDEALARRLQQQQQQQQQPAAARGAQERTGAGHGDASPLARLLQGSSRPTRTISAFDYSDNSGVSQQLFASMRKNGDALSRLQEQAERVLTDARRLNGGNARGNGGEAGAAAAPVVHDIVDDDDDDLLELRSALNDLNRRVGVGDTAQRRSAVAGARGSKLSADRATRPPASSRAMDDSDDLERAIQASLRDIECASDARAANQRSVGKGSGTEAVAAAKQPKGVGARGARGDASQIKTTENTKNNRDSSAARGASSVQSASPGSASRLDNATAIEQARLRLLALQGPSSSSSRATRVDANAEKKSDVPTTGRRNVTGSAADADLGRYGAGAAAQANAVSDTTKRTAESTRAERDSSRANRQARSTARDHFYQEVGSFVREDLAGGARSRAAAASLAGALNDEDALALAIKRSLQP